MADQDVVTVERIIHATPEAIFELLATPSRHCEIDGSGTVRAARGESGDMVGLGDRFGMSMKMGIPYAMENTIIEFEPGRRIAWRTTGPTAVGRMVGGRVWRYELEEVDDGTLVRESWDISGESMLTKPGVKRLANTTRKNMAATLDRIEDVLATAS